MDYYSVIIGFLMITTSIVLLRIIIGPTLWDRILGFNLLSSKIILIMVITASFYENDMYIDVALVYSLIGFLGVVFFCRFLQKGGSLE